MNTCAEVASFANIEKDTPTEEQKAQLEREQFLQAGAARGMCLSIVAKKFLSESKLPVRPRRETARGLRQESLDTPWSHVLRVFRCVQQGVWRGLNAFGIAVRGVSARLRRFFTRFGLRFRVLPRSSMRLRRFERVSGRASVCFRASGR